MTCIWKYRQLLSFDDILTRPHSRNDRVRTASDEVKSCWNGSICYETTDDQRYQQTGILPLCKNVTRRQVTETTVWVKKIPPPRFSDISPKQFEIFSPNFTCLFYVPVYAGIQQSYAILSATTIICWKCPSSIETHAGRSHLIWHNFVKMADNWIKICSLEQVETCNRRVKFRTKIPNRLGKVSANLRGGLTDTV